MAAQLVAPKHTEVTSSPKPSPPELLLTTPLNHLPSIGHHTTTLAPTAPSPMTASCAPAWPPAAAAAARIMRHLLGFVGKGEEGVELACVWRVECVGLECGVLQVMSVALSWRECVEVGSIVLW
jgi:hypothetical protein